MKKVKNNATLCVKFQLHGFMEDDADGLDEASFNLPLLRELGDTIYIKTKAVEQLL